MDSSTEDSPHLHSGPLWPTETTIFGLRVADIQQYAAYDGPWQGIQYISDGIVHDLGRMSMSEAAEKVRSMFPGKGGLLVDRTFPPAPNYANLRNCVASLPSSLTQAYVNAMALSALRSPKVMSLPGRYVIFTAEYMFISDTIFSRDAATQHDEFRRAKGMDAKVASVSIMIGKTTGRVVGSWTGIGLGIEGTSQSSGSGGGLSAGTRPGSASSTPQTSPVGRVRRFWAGQKRQRMLCRLVVSSGRMFQTNYYDKVLKDDGCSTTSVYTWDAGMLDPHENVEFVHTFSINNTAVPNISVVRSVRFLGADAHDPASAPYTMDIHLPLISVALLVHLLSTQTDAAEDSIAVQLLKRAQPPIDVASALVSMKQWHTANYQTPSPEILRILRCVGLPDVRVRFPYDAICGYDLYRMWLDRSFPEFKMEEE